MRKNAKVNSVPGVTAAARLAKAAGQKRFPWTCGVHGIQLFYASSGACPCCTVARKDKDHQAEYNREVKAKYPHVKREDGTWTRKKIQTPLA